MEVGGSSGPVVFYIKEWRRVWKLHLIEENNPTWRDLYEDLL
jgi:predicted GIY-YIG superfamily endonuclease